MGERYISWLMHRARIPEDYFDLCWVLGNEPYRWVHSLDENRRQDGWSLREIYFKKHHLYLDSMWDYECSWLEMLVGLNKRMYELSGESKTYLVVLFDNVELYPDSSTSKIKHILHDLSDGCITFFNFPGAPDELLELQLWHQMNLWVAWYEEWY